MADRSICGIPLEALANRPTPHDVACIVSDWCSDQQAEFFSMLAEQIKNSCGWREDIQFEAIAINLAELESRLCDGGGSQLLRKLVSHLKEAA